MIQPILSVMTCHRSVIYHRPHPLQVLPADIMAPALASAEVTPEVGTAAAAPAAAVAPAPLLFGSGAVQFRRRKAPAEEGAEAEASKASSAVRPQHFPSLALTNFGAEDDGSGAEATEAMEIDGGGGSAAVSCLDTTAVGQKKAGGGKVRNFRKTAASVGDE